MACRTDVRSFRTACSFSHSFPLLIDMVLTVQVKKKEKKVEISITVGSHRGRNSIRMSVCVWGGGGGGEGVSILIWAADFIKIPSVFFRYMNMVFRYRLIAAMLAYQATS